MRHASQTDDSVRAAPPGGLCANRLGSGGMMALGRRDASAELGPRRPRPSSPHNHRISHRATETRCSGGGLHANNPANTPISPRVGCASVCERQHDGLLLGQAVASAQHGHIELSLKHAHCLLHISMHRRACCCVASTHSMNIVETGCKPCHAHRTTQQQAKHPSTHGSTPTPKVVRKSLASPAQPKR